jgi:ABC-2 type transport system permease protein
MSASPSVLPVDTSTLGTPIKGPTALGSDRRRFFRLTIALAVTDFKLRFFGSVLGYLWQLMRPLMLFGVLYLVFSVFLAFGTDLKYYPVALLLGIVLFSFFSEATGSSVRSLVMRENLVRKVEFPRLAVPMAMVLTALMNLCLNLVPVLIFLLAAGGRPRWSWLEVPLLILLLVGFAVGFAMLLSALFVRYRDVEPIWDVVLQVMFYATPILYSIQTVAEKSSETVANILMWSPFAAIMQQTRHAFVDPTSYPNAATAAGGTARLLIPLLLIVVVFAIGARVFMKQAPLIAEDL